MGRLYKFFVLSVLYILFLVQLGFGQSTICHGTKVVPMDNYHICSPENWVLDFEDNFEDTMLDLKKWKVIKGVVRDPYFESSKQWSLPENVRVEDGKLYLTAKRDTFLKTCFDIWIKSGMKHFCSDFYYSNAEISSYRMFSYGKFEARCKIPKGKGFWPAFWTFGPEWDEIDVFEFSKGKTNEVYLTDWRDGINCTKIHYGGDYSADFHVYTVIWLNDRLEWYIDNKLVRRDVKYYSIDGKEVGCDVKSNTFYIMNASLPINPMMIIFNLAIENGKSNSPDNSTLFPSALEVDWVRYYKNADAY